MVKANEKEVKKMKKIYWHFRSDDDKELAHWIANEIDIPFNARIDGEYSRKGKRLKEVNVYPIGSKALYAKFTILGKKPMLEYFNRRKVTKMVNRYYLIDYSDIASWEAYIIGFTVDGKCLLADY